jgi:ribA/ribD-fused uncharacterized protein
MIDSFRGKYRFLSNFYPSPIELQGITYATAEHLFQALKIVDTVPGALGYRRYIAEADTPMEAKKRGQGVPLREDWESIKLDLMECVLTLKFGESAKLRKRLLDTGDKEIAEGNNWGDTFWGTVNDEGRNELGKALMRVRAQLRRASL